ncbi:MAG: adenylate/guanylate cyclase domain-containing protein [Myxococcaceae bacterium]|nr:adenylate/guanylate cyclase domain-containing protein [Myxococcaceae bacterium]
MWQLVINGPGYFDTKYDLPEGTTHVGRADENDIVLSGDLVSRKHARFHVTGNALVFEDLGSRNGSRLNGDKVVGTAPMKPGDVVAVGENSLVVRQPTTAESAATEMVDAGGGGAVRRFGRGVDVSHAVLMARDIQDSIVRRVLDNSLPFELEPEPPPVPSKVKRKAAGDTDENEPRTSEVQVPSDGPSYPVAFHSLVMLFRVAERLATAPTLQAFLDDTTDAIMKRVGASTGVVLVRHSTGVMVPAAVRHARKLQKGEVPVSDAIVDAALTQGQAIAVADVRDDSRFAERESVVLYGIDQVLCVPIGQQTPFDGVLYLNRTSVTEEPIEALLDVCTALAQLLQTALHKFAPKAAAGDRLRGALERFHGPDIVERRVKDLSDQTAKLTQLEEKQVTVLFADIAGFTDEALKLPAERVADLLCELYRVATPLVFSFEGTVDKFVGDSVMALFGAPYGKGDDAIRAVRAGMALKAEWDRAMQKRPPKERFQLKVGLTTGKVLAGTVGSEARLDYTAIGEPVNIASWLCQSADGGQVLITGKTLAAVGARFDVTPLGERPLLGSRVRTAVFEVVDEDDDSGTLSGVR